ncbi:hypothetical protein [Actinomadura sp. 7K507]|uniref:hypothetical protein n=1 Tax=Actinomadura sp. 7K507 TaxID=2530365 RepID=UPI00104A4C8B|nr:hypothetical protein [Actinomadura sp. 7K507]TDC89154.1 hypothetical protein E1285_17060 [Actinomadura sp. 7K507]
MIRFTVPRRPGSRCGRPALCVHFSRYRKDGLVKFTSFWRRSSRLAFPAVAAAALLAFGMASPAAADNPDPIPASFDFSDCPPLPEGASPFYSRCQVAVVTSGSFQVGNFDQTIEEPIRLTYANAYNADTFEIETIFGGLEAPEMLVQPGLFGDPLLSAVYAKVEYAGSFEVPGTNDFDINMGVKIRLINPFLGSNCTVGTNSNPIMLNLTTGTTDPPAPNTPITGEGVSIKRSDPLPEVLQAQHVGNAFSVPGAKGCVFGGGIADWLVNQVGGFPSPAGENTMIQNEYIVSKSYSEL